MKYLPLIIICVAFYFCFWLFTTWLAFVFDTSLFRVSLITVGVVVLVSAFPIYLQWKAHHVAP